MGVRRAVVAATACALLATGCAQEHRAPSPPAPTTGLVPNPAYRPGLPPARAVQALVPLTARTLEVVDLDEVRRQVGLPEVSSHSSAADRASFAQRAAEEAPLLVTDPLARVDERLRTTYGFGADDVSWLARFTGGGVSGWVLSMRPGTDMRAVARAARDRIGPLGSSTIVAAHRLVLHGAAGRGTPVWAADPRWAELVPDPGEAFLLHRGCLPAEPASPGLRPLAGFAITFGDHVATVRVDRDRTDLFARLRLGRGPFARVLRHGVADPSSGRIGYDVPRPADAVALVRRRALPFAACAPAG